MARLGIDMKVLRRRSALWSTVVAVALLVVLMAIGSYVEPDRPGWAGHLISHVAGGLPIVLLLAAALRWWPPPRAVRPGRPARWTVLGGLGMLAAGQVVEAVSAPLEYPNSGTLHTTGGLVTGLGLLILVLGASLALVAAIRERALPVWTALILIPVGLFLVWALFVGIG
jgi:hypothetical protein